MPPHLPPPVRPPPTARADAALAREHWLAVALAMILTALWVGWPGFSGAAPVEPLRLVISCALAGALSLLTITVIELRLAPWRFLP